MNTTIKKIIKGTLAIFVIKLVIVSGFFVFQSCQSEEFEYRRQEESKSNFLNSLKNSNLSLSELEIRTAQKNELSGLIARDMDGATETVCLMEFNGAETSAEVISEILENVSTLGTLIQTKSDHDLITQYELVSTEGTEGNDENDSSETEDETTEPDYDPEDCIALIEIPLQPVVDALDPAVQAAKDYLRNMGFTDQEISEDILSEWDYSEEHLVPFVMYIAQFSENNPVVTPFGYQNLFFDSLHAQSEHTELTVDEVWDCAVEAVGLGFVSAVAMHGAKKAGIKILTKAFTKFVSKFAGPIGVAIMVADFGFCLYGESND